MAGLRDGLDNFAKIFRTDGAAAPQEISTTPPIATVADVSRMKMHGEKIFASFALSHAVADTQRESFLMSSLLALGTPPFNADFFDFWLTEIGITVTAADVANMASAVLGYTGSTTPPIGESTHRARWLGFYSTPSAGAEIIVGDGIYLLTLAPGPLAMVTGSPLPVRIRPDNPGAGIHMVSTSTGAVTAVRCNIAGYITPRGGTPPGMA